jgi:hypothetical protein
MRTESHGFQEESRVAMKGGELAFCILDFKQDYKNLLLKGVMI